MGLFRRSKGEASVPAPAAPAKRARKVLIVDDDITIAELNETVFLRRNWTVKTAYNGLGALSTISLEKPDLVLLDLLLPDIPGEKVLESLKNARLPTKVMVVTGRYVTQKDFEPYKGLVIWVLRKPYPMGDLVELVEWFEGGAEMKPKLSQIGDV
jgi:DNA-binding response OmpR family regulator